MSLKTKKPEIEEIMKMPTIVDHVHQSVFRANGLLLHILEMVNRGDSRETIMDVYYLVSQAEKVEKESGDIK
jgi:hypothetical protein